MLSRDAEGSFLTWRAHEHMKEPTPARTAAANGGMYSSQRVRTDASSLTGEMNPSSGEPRLSSCELRT